jgi:hypothetical protein
MPESEVSSEGESGAALFERNLAYEESLRDRARTFGPGPSPYLRGQTPEEYMGRMEERIQTCLRKEIMRVV